MHVTERPTYTPHTLRIRTATGDLIELDTPEIHQPKLAEQMADKLAAFLAAEPTAYTEGPRWFFDAADDLAELDIDPLTCAVAVYRVAEDWDAAGVNGYAAVYQAPVAPPEPHDAYAIR